MSDHRGIRTIQEKALFLKVVSRGKQVHTALLYLRLARGPVEDENLYAFNLRRKFGPAPIRNRARRLAREYLRLNRGRIRQGFAVMIGFKSGWEKLSFATVAPALEEALLAARLIEKGAGQCVCPGQEGRKNE